MKQILLLIATFCVAMNGLAQQRNAKAMTAIAHRYAEHIHAQNITLKATSSALLKDVKADNEAFAVYAADKRPGFVIVSADERMPEILAISDKDNFDTQEGKNEALMELLNSYAAAHQLISEGKATAEELFGRSDVFEGEADLIKEPLLGAISFNQDSPYNRMTPTISGKHSPTGCVPTGMAMIMKYFNYPEVGTGSKSYNTKTHNLPVSFDFSAKPFDWDNILDTYGSYVNESTANITYNASRVFYFSDEGGFEWEEHYPTWIKVTKCYQNSGRTISGNLQFVVEDEDGTIRRIAGEAKVVDNLGNNYGWSYTYLKPCIPGDLPDGEYYLYLAFTEDDKTFTYAKESYRSNQNYYVRGLKEGNTFTWDDHVFPCACNLQEADAVSTLMAACGAACEADYGTDATSASSYTAMRGLHEYLNYDSDIFCLSNEDAQLNDIYKETKRNMDAGLVVPTSGSPEQGSGHFYIIDGYDMTGSEPMFHINWGWGGNSDGYFLLTYMKPSSAGTGGDETNYSYSFYVFSNVQPENNVNDSKVMACSKISSSKKTVSPNTNITLSVTELTNQNLITVLKGSVYLYLVDEEENAYKCGQFFVIDELKPNYYYSTTISRDVSIPANIPNGTYHLELRLSDNDRFFALENQTITMTGSTTGINDVEAITDSSEPAYDLTGRPVSKSHRGIQIKKGVKQLKRR